MPPAAPAPFCSSVGCSDAFGALPSAGGEVAGAATLLPLLGLIPLAELLCEAVSVGEVGEAVVLGMASPLDSTQALGAAESASRARSQPQAACSITTQAVNSEADRNLAMPRGYAPTSGFDPTKWLAETRRACAPTAVEAPVRTWPTALTVCLDAASALRGARCMWGDL